MDGGTDHTGTLNPHGALVILAFSRSQGRIEPTHNYLPYSQHTRLYIDS